MRVISSINNVIIDSAAFHSDEWVSEEDTVNSGILIRVGDNEVSRLTVDDFFNDIAVINEFFSIIEIEINEFEAFLSVDSDVFNFHVGG